MSDVTALQSRIAGALDRIRVGVEGMSTSVDESLQARLAEEQTANAQLEERVKALKERQDGKITELEGRVTAQAEQMAKLDAELQRLRTSNADLRDVNAQLRAAATDGVAQPELINRALMAEVEALSAQRAADAAEVDAILSDLKPLVREA
ncbi:hypothetical protein SAMN04488515_1306 [Cognatiyoonia koreensis]|uniref:Uncharacterized protein n=1 Tax=Cognatiyoonia koreensis TaxID=364200 RepID=A0A1I0PM15_9RHOB|nr:hypothetical protein [Cognatiyoonia koreensis]SEW15389.1 hypothetical protein SAMN04488515_1306 [Cognatiyoonia koreensis]